MKPIRDQWVEISEVRHIYQKALNAIYVNRSVKSDLATRMYYNAEKHLLNVAMLEQRHKVRRELYQYAQELYYPTREKYRSDAALSRDLSETYGGTPTNWAHFIRVGLWTDPYENSRSSFSIPVRIRKFIAFAEELIILNVKTRKIS